ncbi:MAG: PAS domain S-box-containing protein [Candidatus Woesearchaeota archaeon]|jgi:PAS domain S-box-containing protein
MLLSTDAVFAISIIFFALLLLSLFIGYVYLFSKYRSNFSKLKNYLNALHKENGEKQTVTLFVQFILRNIPCAKSAFIISTQHDAVVGKFGFGIPTGSLSELQWGKRSILALQNQKDHCLLPQAILQALAIPLETSPKGIYYIPFTYSNKKQYIFILLSASSFRKSFRVFLDVCADQTQIKLQSIDLDLRSKKLATDIGSIESAFQRILDRSPTAKILLDTSGKILYANKALNAIFRIDGRKSLVGSHYDDLFLQGKKEIQNMFDSICDKQSQHESISRLPSKTVDDLRLSLDVYAYPITDSHDTVIQVAVAIRDATKRYQLEQELRLSQEMATKDLHQKVQLATRELVQSNRELTRANRIRSEFVSIVSHELRTPLTSILGYISLLENEKLGDVNKQQKEALHILKDESKRLANLINDVLDFSRLESGKTTLKLEKIHLGDLAKSVTQALSPQLKKKQLTIEIQSGRLTTAQVDKGKITQVFSNLLSNAIKFSPKHSVITITLTTTKHAVIASIADTGIGMTKTDVKKVFDSFYMVEHVDTKQYAGTGLGLTIVKHIVDLHKGKIAVASELGKGATFTMTLPKHQ